MEALLALLAQSQVRGFIGPGDLTDHVRHARAFLGAIQASPSPVTGPHGGEVALDLGAGGGLPGLVLALDLPDSTWVLLDANEQRTTFLREAVTELGLEARVEVRRGRAEAEAHDPALRGRFGLVVARGFGPPAVVAECSAAFLAVGGRLIVSEPPDSVGERWNHPAALAAFGLGPAVILRDGAGFALLGCVEAAPATVPRRVGVPAKRPAF